MISSSAVYSTVFSQGISHGMWLLAWREWMIFHFRLFKSILFCVHLISSCFSISYIVLTCYVYYYCIWFGFNTLFSCSFAGFLLFSPKGSVTDVTPRMGIFCYSPLYFLSRMHLRSGYCYYYYVQWVCWGPRGLQKLSFEYFGLLLSKEVSLT